MLPTNGPEKRDDDWQHAANRGGGKGDGPLWLSRNTPLTSLAERLATLDAGKGKER